MTLTAEPVNPDLTVLNVIGGPAQEYGVDYEVIADALSWNGLYLESVLTEGDTLIVQFY